MTATDTWNGPIGRHWADHPDRYNAMLAGFDAPLFDAAAIAAADRVLDIGCGSGHTTRTAARRAPRGRVTGVDISAPLLERARSLTPAAQYPSVSYESGDAQTHPFEPGGYDVAISRGGVMFFADHIAAFTHIAGALRPGGRLAFICPQPPRADSGESKVLGLLASLLGRDHTSESAVATAMASSPIRSASTTCWARPGSRRSPRSPWTRPPAGAGTRRTWWSSSCPGRRGRPSPRRPGPR